MKAPVLPANGRGHGDRRNPRLGLQYTLAGHLAGSVLDSILLTVRWDIRGAEHHRALVDAGQAFILAFWHGRLLPLGYLHRGGGHSMMISRSKDGEYGSGLARHWGQVPVRGSSSRGGGPALGEMLAHAAAGHTLAFTPDGPRGPRWQVQPGAVLAAQRTGLPILPFTCAATRGWYLRSWDRMLIPKPFSRVLVRYAAPFHVAAGDDVEQATRRLQEILVGLTLSADREAGAPADPVGEERLRGDAPAAGVRGEAGDSGSAGHGAGDA